MCKVLSPFYIYMFVFCIFVYKFYKNYWFVLMIKLNIFLKFPKTFIPSFMYFLYLCHWRTLNALKKNY